MTDFAPPGRRATAHLIRRSLADFARRMRRIRADHGISAARLSVLGRLQRAGRPLSATELAQLEGLQPQSLTRIIADLADRGLITRHQNAHDRRQLDIAISAEGTELLTHDARNQNEWLAHAMETHLTPAERTVLTLAAELLDRIVDHEMEPTPDRVRQDAESD